MIRRVRGIGADGMLLWAKANDLLLLGLSFPVKI